MKEITCDICGKKLGTEYRNGVSFFCGEPGWKDIIDVEKFRYIDVCNDCEDELSKAVHKTIEDLKKNKGAKW